MKRLMLLLSVMIVLVGCSSDTVDVDGEVIKYETLLNKIEEKQSELKGIEDKLNDVKRELTQNEAKYNKLEKMSDEQDRVQKELDEAKVNLINMQSDVSKAQKELEKLQGEIVKVKGNPIKLSAGHFTVDKDLPIGRYEITPTQGSGNVFIRDADGDSKVRQILGSDPDHHVPSFIFNAEIGDTLELLLPVTFTPIE